MEKKMQNHRKKQKKNTKTSYKKYFGLMQKTVLNFQKLSPNSSAVFESISQFLLC